MGTTQIGEETKEMSQRLLEAAPNLSPDPALQDLIRQGEEISRLREKVATLESENQSLRDEIITVSKGVSSLRRQLTPLYRALQQVFGEMEAVAPDSHSEPFADLPLSPAKNAVWQSWIAKLPGKRAEIIKALLEHGEMTVAQLRVATHSGQATIYSSVYELNKLGLIVKTAKGSYSLKQL